MRVLGNLELGSYLSAAKSQRARSLESAPALFAALRDKLGAMAGDLSDGQQLMAAIARALMARPKLLLLDETSLGLAPRIVLDMFESIRRINADGVSALLVEKNVVLTLEVAQRAYVLEEGRIVATGAPAELLARPEIERAYLGVWVRGASWAAGGAAA